MEDDWDLQAVVRGYSTTSTAAAASSATNTTNNLLQDFHSVSCFSSPEQGGGGGLFSLSGPFKARNAVEELHELYKPFFPKSHSLPAQNKSISSLSSFGLSSQPKLQQQQPKQSPPPTTHSHTQRSKRRKNQQKKVCQLPAESLSSDIWSWRKYGQKPIKGSPYPRGYYRCSSSKGCLARKQVERNRSDPGMFIVTYTAEHNHPAPTHKNSLAGTTRQKPTAPQTLTKAGDSNKPSTSPATSMEEEPVPQSTKTQSREEMAEDEEEGEFGLSEMVLGDDLFAGLEGLAGPITGECFSDQFKAFCDVGLCLL